MRLRANKNRIGVFLIVFGIILACVVMFLFIHDWETRHGMANVVNPDAPEYSPGALYCNEKWYVPKRGITTVLGIGLDKFKAEISDKGYNNSQQADVLMLFIFNHDDNSVTALHINRDTMAQIPVLGVFGDLTDFFEGQLALSHTYGSGGKESCQNTVRAVSRFLYGAPIDHYISFTMDAVPEITDLAGGVKLILLDDFTMHDPAMKKGTEFLLDGEKALIYVRGRLELENTSNVNRMKRQRQYLNALKESVAERYDGDADFIMDSVKLVSEYILSDCTVNQLSEFYKMFLTWKDNGIIEVEGETKKGEYMEFYADEEALQELVISLLYEPYYK